MSNTAKLPTTPAPKVRPETWEYELVYARKFGETLIETITFKNPTMGHISQLGGDVKLGDFMRIAAALNKSALSPRFFKDLDPEDGMAIADRIGDFLPSGQ